MAAALEHINPLLLRHCCPHRAAMRERIAAICGVDVDRVSVKATTNDQLGFVGRAEGIAAIATAAVRLPVK